MSLQPWTDKIEDLVKSIYEELSSDPDNTRANRIIDLITPLLPDLCEWKPYYSDDGCYQLGWECSGCAHQTSSWVTPFCPSCGAVMENYQKITRHHTTLDRKEIYG